MTIFTVVMFSFYEENKTQKNIKVTKSKNIVYTFGTLCVIV
jgi:hypothetical protein